jgi:hypothetical protein
MCLDPATSLPFATQPGLVFDPKVVLTDGTFHVYGMSRDFEVVGASFKSDRGYCTGPGSSNCVVGGACAGWSIGAHTGTASVGVSPAMFATTGVHTGSFLVGDNGADPCNINMQPPHKITGGSITVE